jgi:uncharacterized membrane protein YfcA
MDIGIELLIALSFVAIAAGFIDAIAGGGGLLTIPALLFAGVPPVQTLATNKLQACFGSFTATRYFIKQNLVSPKQQIGAIIAAAIGAMIGAYAIQLFNADILVTLLPFALIAIAIYLVFSKNLDNARPAKLSKKTFNFTVVTGIGFYDGFFGPGTGTFYTLSYCKIRALNLIQATAHAKLANFTTNIASLFIFILSDEILWTVGLAMAVGQVIGARLGAATAMKQGTVFIRYVSVVMCIAMSIGLLIKE